MDAANNDGRVSLPADRFLGATRVAALGLTLMMFSMVRPPTLSDRLFEVDLGLVVAGLFGTFLPILCLHPFRVTGLLPPAVLTAAVAIASCGEPGPWPQWAALLLGIATGVGVGTWLRYEFRSPPH